jgi:hypothetical protein
MQSEVNLLDGNNLNLARRETLFHFSCQIKVEEVYSVQWVASS